MTLDSGTTLERFNPYIIPFQTALMELVNDWDYSKSTPEILCSGSYGSSKSLCAAHLIIRHCLAYPGACGCICRRALPDIKKTIYNEIVEHLECDSLREGKDYKLNTTKAEVYFANGSKIISASWADRRYKKFRSLKLSFLLVEEITENDLEDRQAFMTLKARMRRIPGINGPVIALTNPDSADHWVYDYFIEGSNDFNTRRVLYSVTSDNIFLDPVYIEQLRADLSPKEALRYIHGQWLSLKDDVIYSEYDEDFNFINDDYKISPYHSIGMTCDFNIGDGKPMSWAFFQNIDNKFHFFDEVVLESTRTQAALEECDNKRLFDFDTVYQICGDSAGKNRDTRSKKSDYQIIYDYLEKMGVRFERKVPAANPPIRTRHNTVNSFCKNDLGNRRLFVYKNCKTLNKGLKLTKLKPGANYIEDDSKACPWQHITTAIGYAICALDKSKLRQSRSYQR